MRRIVVSLIVLLTTMTSLAQARPKQMKVLQRNGSKTMKRLYTSFFQLRICGLL